MIKDALTRLQSHDTLSYDMCKDVMDGILNGKETDNDILLLLESYDNKNISPEELTGFLDSLMTHSQPFNSIPTAIDTCGTGGSGQSRFNVSTVVGFVLAAAGETVVKHGNYGSVSPNGSFNFLEEMGIPFLLAKENLETLVSETNICFLFARLFHPAMKYVATARKQFQKRSFFNLLGPLANPAQVKHQLIGLPNSNNLDLLINCIKFKNMNKVVFVIGGDGKDEISLDGTSQIVEVKDNDINSYSFNFQQEIKPVKSNYPTGTSKENAALFNSIMTQKEFEHPIIEHVCINAAAGFVALETCDSLHEGYKKSKQLFENGLVQKKIDTFKQRSIELASLD